MFGCDAKMLVEIANLTRCAKSLHSMEDAIFTNYTVQAQRNDCFNCKLHRRIAKDSLLVAVALLFKKLETWNRNNTGRNAFSFKKITRFQSNFNFGAGRKNCDFCFAACGCKLIGTIATEIFFTVLRANDGQVLARQSQSRRGFLRLKGKLPALSRFHCVRRAEYVVVGNGTQCRQMLNGLVSWTILT